jgi:hypothetical protein
MFDIGFWIKLLFFSQFIESRYNDIKKNRKKGYIDGCLFYFLFREKKRYLVHLSFVYLSFLLSMKKVFRLCFWVPRSPEWIGSFLPTK